jgi:predicted DNA-binding transcriptional regulator AlpA
VSTYGITLERVAFEHMGRKVDVDQLVDAAEVARRLGLAGPQVVHNWRRRHADFPSPVARFGHAVVWVWSDVKAWLRRTGRPGQGAV